MKRLIVLGALAMVLGLSAREPSMKLIDKPFDRKGEKLQHKEWVVKFHHADLNLKNIIDKDGKLVKKAWGDFFLGLDLFGFKHKEVTILFIVILVIERHPGCLAVKRDRVHFEVLAFDIKGTETDMTFSALDSMMRSAGPD